MNIFHLISYKGVVSAWVNICNTLINIFVITHGIFSIIREGLNTLIILDVASTRHKYFGTLDMFEKWHAIYELVTETN